jgi:hypothetical protein
MTNFFLKVIGLLLLFESCSTVKPSGHFNPEQIPEAPNYSNLSNWAAHPQKEDPADRIPCATIKNEQSTAAADVFFIHPTTYTGADKHQNKWNAALDDEKINNKTDNTSILFQASIFNGAGRVFAPRYRQAHLNSFFTKTDTLSAKLAIKLAYSDVKEAFEYYLKHWNNGRPFIIAGHSQGGLHTMYLLKELIEKSPLRKQLVVAYAVGYPIPDTFFKYIKPCQTPNETGCFCTWRTFERNYALKKMTNSNIVCNNPLTWSTIEGQYAPHSLNKGGVVRPFCAIYPALSDAEIYKGVLISKKPKFPGSRLMRTHNYHPGDLNLYYMNIRENAQDRVKFFLMGEQSEKKQD